MDVLESEAHQFPLRPRRISKNRNGTPITAVTIPIGTMVPGEISFDRIEAPVITNAPVIAAIGIRMR